MDGAGELAEQASLVNKEFHMPAGQVFTLGKMSVLWEDLEHTVKHFWVTSVPTLLTVGPKLKSDQWRMLGSVYLPINLIHIWSVAGGDAWTTHHHNLLALTMSLLSAVVIATSCITTSRHIDEYFKHMVNYHTQLQELFPEYKCHPNHHMALHLNEFLRMYGPVYGWWAFPFECMIGMLQHISTNYKPHMLTFHNFWLLSLNTFVAEEYEETIGHSWH